MDQIKYLIPLTQGQWAIVDQADYDNLMRWKWHAVWAPSTRSYYAQRATCRDANGRQELITMHRYLLGLEKGNRLRGDHINHDTLDNRRANLRIATTAQNAHNVRRARDNRSGYKGVTKNYGQWVARITVDGKLTTLGRFGTPEEAHECYKAAANAHFGEYAYAGESA